MSKVIKVTFKEPVNGCNEAIFSSIGAIFSMFRQSQIGCSKQDLWLHKITPDHPYIGQLCIIEECWILKENNREKKTIDV